MDTGRRQTWPILVKCVFRCGLLDWALCFTLADKTSAGMQVERWDGLSVDSAEVKQKLQYRSYAEIWWYPLMLCSFWFYLEGENCKGCRGKKVRFREKIGVWCASRGLDRIKQHIDYICICEINEL